MTWTSYFGKQNSTLGSLVPLAMFGFRPQASACAFGWAKLGFMQIWPNVHIFARQIWSSGVSLRRSCKMQFRRINLRSIGPSSRKLRLNLIFGRFSHCNLERFMGLWIWNFTSGLVLPNRMHRPKIAAKIPKKMLQPKAGIQINFLSRKIEKRSSLSSSPSSSTSSSSFLYSSYLRMLLELNVSGHFTKVSLGNFEYISATELVAKMQKRICGNLNLDFHIFNRNWGDIEINSSIGLQDGFKGSVLAIIILLRIKQLVSPSIPLNVLS